MFPTIHTTLSTQITTLQSITFQFGSPLLSCRVQYEDFTYPNYGVPLVEAYDGRFESAFILLHPFIHVPAALSWSVTSHYPNDVQILEHATKFPWAQVSAKTGLGSCARINQALLTSIGSLADPLADPSASNTLQSFLENHPVWMPTEGRFEPLLQSDILQVFSQAEVDELIFVPEFPHADPIVNLPIADLKTGNIPFPTSGTLLAPDASFLFTVDWDSFFTLFYGSRAFIARAAQSLNLEGFFATANTDHAWFNYSMGCATVTLSPEDWQTDPVSGRVISAVTS
ncbi:DUF2711 family protein [Telmatobacter sp. DSM 110680]|uniref:DUF2711 family protein n=1 Tax=Telmatobacter sp. DSM 110680 TaxID=3036704 RepID=A0AAU7DQG3_9BACT